jgi:hypothetical protein
LDILKYGLIILLTFVVGFVLQHRQASSTVSVEETPDNHKKKHTIKAGKDIYLTGYISLFLWFALICLSGLFPGSSKSVLIPQCIFSFFLCLSLILIYCAHLYLITWDRDQIQGTTFIGKRYAIAWNEAASCEYQPLLQVFLIKEAHGPAIVVPETWDGVLPLVRFIEKNYPNLLPQDCNAENGDDEDWSREDER